MAEKYVENQNLLFSSSVSHSSFSSSSSSSSSSPSSSSTPASSSSSPYTVLLPFGLNSEYFLENLEKNIRRAIQGSPMENVTPRRVWCVAGSATLLTALSRIWPTSHFLVVQVGKKIWPDQLGFSHLSIYCRFVRLFFKLFLALAFSNVQFFTESEKTELGHFKLSCLLPLKIFMTPPSTLLLTPHPCTTMPKYGNFCANMRKKMTMFGM